MAIAEHTLETLEFPRVRERLAQYTAFSASRELALTLEPATERDAVEGRLNLTSEARRLLDEQPDLTIGGARDVREAAQHARRGGMLESSTLLELAGTLRSMRRLRERLHKLADDVFPLLIEFGADLPQLSAIEDAIESTIGDDGGVLDSASQALGRIRREIRVASSRLQERLHSLITSDRYASALQEPIVTVRGGRYVVPVKAAQRRSLPGLVHDQSASGATLYIEPMAVVELNNQLREAQLAEEQEVQRILVALSERVGGAAGPIVAGIETLALIDLAFAQAKYAQALRCVAPTLTWLQTAEQSTAQGQAAEQATANGQAADGPDDLFPLMLHAPGNGTEPPMRYLPPPRYPLYLPTARHPLLNQETVVPIDIWLGGETQLVLITGPNTGGKTVALKTVGLLALMAQSGLHIPANAPARLPIFTQIYADIGDEQSIEQSLSTFSSHMTNIIRILQALDAVDEDRIDSGDWEDYEGETVLVLLDELGAGTDPVEGSALARAIIGRLLERGCLGICTTHYAELKAFAHSAPGVQNASVEFDIETLAPTYRLTIGLPGRSNALAIAARLGLDPALVAAARSEITGDEVQLEGLLATIHREREEAAATLQRAEQVRADAEKYRERYEEALRTFEATVQEQIDAVNAQLERELQEMRTELRRSRTETPSASLARKWTQEAEERLRAMQAHVQETGQGALAAVPRTAVLPGRTPPRPLQPGDKVFVRSVGLKGEILSIDAEDETAEVQVGGFRMQTGLHELQREKGDAPAPRDRTPQPRTVTLPAQPDVPLYFDMRGWRASDVAEPLERYLNDAYLMGLPQVRLVHGKGSGVLRQVVRDMLQRHPLVRSFSGGGADGGEGVTIATLNER